MTSEETGGKSFDDVLERLAGLKEMRAVGAAQEWQAYVDERYPGDMRMHDTATLAYLHVDDDYDGWHHVLNDKVSFNLTNEGKTASLHLGEAHELSPAELKRTVVGGFGALAQRLSGREVADHRFPGEGLGSVTEVRVTSWIVREHPRIIEKGLGFSIDDRIDKLNTAGRKQWGAVMSRDDFVARYLPGEED